MTDNGEYSGFKDIRKLTEEDLKGLVALLDATESLINRIERPVKEGGHYGDDHYKVGEYSIEMMLEEYKCKPEELLERMKVSAKKLARFIDEKAIYPLGHYNDGK